MNIGHDETWKESIAQSVVWLVLGIALVVFVTNLVGFVLPFLVGLRFLGADTPHATMQMGLAWVGVIGVFRVVPLVVGSWKGTPMAAPTADFGVPWFRFGLRSLALVHSGLVVVLAALRFAPDAASLAILSWSSEALWWCFVLLGLEYVRRIFRRLDREDAAKRAQTVGYLYALLVACTITLFVLAETLQPATMGGDAPNLWPLTVGLGQVLVEIVAFLLLTRVLWELRRVLMQPGMQERR
jgi:hypothetical protein